MLTSGVNLASISKFEDEVYQITLSNLQKNISCAHYILCDFESILDVIDLIKTKDLKVSEEHISVTVVIKDDLDQLVICFGEYLNVRRDRRVEEVNLSKSYPTPLSIDYYLRWS